MGDVVHQRTDDACVGVRVGRDLAELVVVDLEARLCLVLVGKDLDDLLPLHHLLDVAVDRRELKLLLFEVAAALFRDAAHDVEHGHAHADHDEHDRDGQGRHHPEHEDQRGDRDQHLRDRMVQQLVDRLGIVGVIAHQLAVRTSVEERDRERLHLLEHLLAQRAHDARGAGEHQPVQQEVGENGDRVQDRHADEQRGILCHVRADPGFEHLDELLRHQHRVVGRGGIRKDRDDRNDQDPGAVFEIAEQANERFQRLFGALSAHLAVEGASSRRHYAFASSLTCDS